ncbi:MAG: ornithine carbamoyltransferase, partial [Porticoccus sp.]|nr:ornithine carbamoyltransferase [Porticoccus sp.]
MNSLLNISDLKKDDFKKIINYAKILNKKFDNSLLNKNIGLIFEKNSTRTRLSFQVGIRQLNGNFIDI